MIKNKINEVEGTNNMFAPYGKIKIKPSNEHKIKLRITNFFSNIDIGFRKAITGSKNVYFINAIVYEAKILGFEQQSLARGENLSVRPYGYLQRMHKFYCFPDFELNFRKKPNSMVKILTQLKVCNPKIHFQDMLLHLS